MHRLGKALESRRSETKPAGRGTVSLCSTLINKHQRHFPVDPQTQESPYLRLDSSSTKLTGPPMRVLSKEKMGRGAEVVDQVLLRRASGWNHV